MANTPDIKRHTHLVDEMMEQDISEAYSKGVAKGAEMGYKQRSSDDDRMMRAFVDKLGSLIMSPGHVEPVAQKSTPGTWQGFRRAAEHLISDLDPSTGATPHGVYSAGSSWAAELASSWMQSAMPSATYCTLIEAPAGESGWPQLPKMVVAPSAGPQGGEKLPAHSRAWDLAVDDAAGKIDSTLYLNVSALVIEQGFLPIVDALMAAAVAHEANSQIVSAIESAATSASDAQGAFSAFDQGRFTPLVVVVPPSQVLNIDASGLVAAGIRVVVDPAASNLMVLSPDAVVGWFKRLRVQRTEPDMLGEGIAFGCLGRVSVDPSGVSLVAGP